MTSRVRRTFALGAALTDMSTSKTLRDVEGGLIA